MPLTPSYGDRRIGPIQRLYRKTEKRLIQWLAKTVAPGVGHGWAWAYNALSRLLKFRVGVDRIMSETDNVMQPRVESAIRGAWRDGLTEARRDAGPAPAPDERPMWRIIDDTTEAIRGAHRHVPRSLDNVYREIVDAAVHPREIGEQARRDAVQRALEAFARQGITGFMDSRGRRYDFVTYVETAVRSAITRAEVDAYCAQAVSAGHDLVIVSDVAGSCPLCRPFEGQVLSITGNTVGAIARDNSTGHAVRVRVLCSLAQARERGLWHRNCRHTLKVWTPDDPAPPRAARVPAEVRERRRRQRSAARRNRIRERVGFVAQS
ncbi:phage minor capsid protein [Nocardia xishanensis]|uniref:phage minor capsid protein n=1 Tax=Nocardia xishanensis TaxID=238964 RepID=UPI0009FD84F8|nr:phage minor capsid protein [Nocardia xishanensis]